jgi:hypothetical protein
VTAVLLALSERRAIDVPDRSLHTRKERWRPAEDAGASFVLPPAAVGRWLAWGPFARLLSAESEVVSALLDRVALANVPHRLQLRPGCSPQLRAMARARGMTRDTDIPLMVVDDTEAVEKVDARGLVVKVLQPAQAEVHVNVVAAGFQAPVEHFRQLITPVLMGRPGVCCYVGEVDGNSVATAVSVRLENHVGIFNVATLPANSVAGTARRSPHAQFETAYMTGHNGHGYSRVLLGIASTSA